MKINLQGGSYFFVQNLKTTVGGEIDNIHNTYRQQSQILKNQNLSQE